MKSNFDTNVPLENNILEGEDEGSEKTTDQSNKSSAPEGSRTTEEPSSSTPHSSPSKTSRTHQEALSPEEKVAAYYNGFNDGGRYA